MHLQQNLYCYQCQSFEYFLILKTVRMTLRQTQDQEQRHPLNPSKRVDKEYIANIDHVPGDICL